MCYIIEYQYYSAKEKGLTFLLFLGVFYCLQYIILVQLMYSWHFPKNIYLKENSVLLGTALGEFSQP